jgi:glycosyltransferase involved in cell wall biosynthesis
MQTTKKILIVCSSSAWGGTEKNALLRALELKKRGYHVHLACVNGELRSRAIAANFKTIHQTPRGGDLNPLPIFRMIKLICKISPDVLFVTMNKDYWLGGLVGFLCAVKTRVMYLGIEREVKKSLKYKLIHNYFLRTIIVNSVDIKKTLLKSSYVQAKNIYVIRNGFQVSPIRRQVALKKQLDLKTETILIGAAGRIMEQKGFDLVPDVLSMLENKSVHIAIAGEGASRSSIESKAKEKAVSDRLHFIGFQADMANFFENIDLFALFSRSEGMANVLNEAMSFGLPVISTDVSGVRELLKDATLGPIVPVENPRAMARAIDNLLKDGFVSAEILQAQIRENYSIDRMISDTEKAFGLDK